MNLRLRRFEKSDFAKLNNWVQAVSADNYMQKVTPLNVESVEDLDYWGINYVWFAITVNEVAIGGVWIDKRRPNDTLGILGILIGSPEKLGKGIGRQAISLAIAEAQQILGITQVRLTVRKTNQRAIRAYRSVGFEVSGKGTTTLETGLVVPFYRMETEPLGEGPVLTAIEPLGEGSALRRPEGSAII